MLAARPNATAIAAKPFLIFTLSIPNGASAPSRYFLLLKARADCGASGPAVSLKPQTISPPPQAEAASKQSSTSKLYGPSKPAAARPRSAYDRRQRVKSLVASNTPPIASTTGMPEPISGAGTRRTAAAEETGPACAAAATPTHIATEIRNLIGLSID